MHEGIERTAYYLCMNVKVLGAWEPLGWKDNGSMKLLHGSKEILESRREAWKVWTWEAR